MREPRRVAVLFGLLYVLLDGMDVDAEKEGIESGVRSGKVTRLL